MADTFDINALVESATQGQDTSVATQTTVCSGTAAQTKSKSGKADV